MPTIRPSSDLRNNYSEISELCHKHAEPVFITRNGQGDLAVMSMETYELLSGKRDLYRLIEEGLESEAQGAARTREDVVADIRAKLGY